MRVMVMMVMMGAWPDDNADDDGDDGGVASTY